MPHGKNKIETGKNQQPTSLTLSMKRRTKWEAIFEARVTGEVDCDVWCSGHRAGDGEEGQWRAK